MANRELFGTDGIRGRVNQHPMTAELVLKLGRAAGLTFRRGDHRHSVVIGKDTRLSGYQFESALQAGFTSMGVHCLLVGVMPTPAVAFLTRAFRADAGVMITASHNASHDNGIKFFGSDGFKLPDDEEAAIEEMLKSDLMDREQPPPNGLGRAQRIDDSDGRYIEFCKNSFDKTQRLNGLRVVVDCAHGASYKVAPQVFWELGAEVIAMGNQPNGFNINDGYGSLHPKRIVEKVKEVRADVGIAFDGDADRVIICDEKGELLDGDQIMAMTALEMKRRGVLSGKGVVATVMSNLGLERLLKKHRLKLERTQVGDRYVMEKMRAEGFNIGGEQSGHLIFLDHNTTGDGLISALKVLELIATHQKPLSELHADMQRVPQVLKNVRYRSSTAPLEDDKVKDALRQAEKELGNRGRVLVRKSGTEPKIRVMVEGDDTDQINALVDGLCDTIGKFSAEA